MKLQKAKAFFGLPLGDPLSHPATNLLSLFNVYGIICHCSRGPRGLNRAPSDLAGHHDLLRQGLESSEHMHPVNGFNEHSEEALASHANGPRDLPRCGALSLLHKPLHNRGSEELVLKPL